MSAEASSWESKMGDSIRFWESFMECEGEVAEWIQSAEKLFQEKAVSSKSNLEMHKVSLLDSLFKNKISC